MCTRSFKPSVLRISAEHSYHLAYTIRPYTENRKNILVRLFDQLTDRNFF